MIASATVDFDVIVIGAGPAGAVAARELARRGLQVALVDRKAFPRPKVCGGCLNQAALAVLRQIGLGDLPALARGARLTQFRAQAPYGAIALSLPSGIAVSRTALDADLVAAAQSAGVRFISLVRARLSPVLPGEPYRRVTLEPAGEPARDCTAKIVIWAAGLGSTGDTREPALAAQVADDALVGVGALLSDYPAGYAAGTIYMAVGTGGYAGLARVEAGQLNVAAALQPEFIKRVGGASLAVEQLIREAGYPPLAGLEHESWRGAVALTRKVDRPAAERLLIVGDAAGYIEPFTGEGMAWAMAGAVACAEIVASDIHAWSPASEDRWIRAHAKLVVERQRNCRRVAKLLRSPLLLRGCGWLLRWFPWLASPLVAELNRPPAAWR